MKLLGRRKLEISTRRSWEIFRNLLSRAENKSPICCRGQGEFSSSRNRCTDRLSFYDRPTESGQNLSRASAMGRVEGMENADIVSAIVHSVVLRMEADADRVERTFANPVTPETSAGYGLSTGPKIFANEHTYYRSYGFVGIRKFGQVFELGHYLHRSSRSGLSSIRMRACTRHLRTHTCRRSNIRGCESCALREGDTRMQILMIGPQ